MDNQYTYRVEWSEEDGAFVARCLEFPSLAAHGSTHEDALRELKSVVQFAVEDMESSGEPVPEPLGIRKYSGRILVRFAPEVHRELALESADSGISINQLIVGRVHGASYSCRVVEKSGASDLSSKSYGKAPIERESHGKRGTSGKAGKRINEHVVHERSGKVVRRKGHGEDGPKKRRA